jgi:hypothetical protein
VTEVVFKPRDCFNKYGEAKVAFTTRREAKQAAQRMTGQPSPYRCSYCGQFHLGNPVPRLAQ